MVLLIVMYRITREMYFSRDRKKDRHHRRALGPALGRRYRQIHQAGYRRGKYKGPSCPPPGAWTTTTATRRPKAALDNSDWMFLLGKARVHRDDGQARPTHHGRRDEASVAVAAHRTWRLFGDFIHSPAGNGIGRLIVDPHSLLLFSSRAEDFSAIEARDRAVRLRAIDAVLRDRARDERRTTALVLLANIAITSASIAIHARWIAPPGPPTLAVLDVGELYRLKEAQVTAILVNRDAPAENARGVEARQRLQPGAQPVARCAAG